MTKKKLIIIFGILIFLVLAIVSGYFAFRPIMHHGGHGGDIAAPLTIYEPFSEGFTVTVTDMQREKITFVIERNAGHNHLSGTLGRATLEYFDGENWREMPFIRAKDGNGVALGFVPSTDDDDPFPLTFCVDISYHPQLRRGRLYRIRKLVFPRDADNWSVRRPERHDFTAEFYWTNP